MALCTEPDQVLAAFGRAFVARNVDAMVELYEDDATYYPLGPGVAHRGKAAIHAAWTAMLDDVEFVGLRAGEVAEQIVGDYAISHMTFLARIRRRGLSDEPRVLEARSTTILHRGVDGGWRYHIDHASAPSPLL